MQQWLNEPKNQPIVYAVAGLFTIGAIVFILFQLQVIGGPAPYVPPPTEIGNDGGPPTGGPPTGGGPPTATPSATSTASTPTGQTPTGSYQSPTSAVSAPVRPPSTGSAALASRNVSPTAPAVVQLAAAPNARVDPFAPYGGVHTIYVAPKPRVDSFAPPLTITNFSVPNTQVASAATPGLPNGANVNAEPTFAGRLNGVMLGNGAYALVDSGGQSLVLQPGDQIPGGGQLISIDSDSISVKFNGQLVKVPISSGNDNGTNPSSTGTQNGYVPGGSTPSTNLPPYLRRNQQLGQ